MIVTATINAKHFLSEGWIFLWARLEQMATIDEDAFASFLIRLCWNRLLLLCLPSARSPNNAPLNCDPHGAGVIADRKLGCVEAAAGKSKASHRSRDVLGLPRSWKRPRTKAPGTALAEIKADTVSRVTPMNIPERGSSILTSTGMRSCCTVPRTK